jgi:N-acetylmuramoyl-L-alanine amidase
LSIQALRLGEHSGTTRIVMDASGRASYHYDLDNDLNLLVIELPHAAWKAASAQTFASSPMVASYTTQALESGGTRLILQLKAPTKVVYEKMMPAGGGSPDRIVLDLKK